jgi:hypothetical protein
MKNALISPNESPIKYISGWYDPDPTNPTIPVEPIFTPIENSCRVAEVLDVTFEVATPLFWTLCDDDVIADQFYYSIGDDEIYPIPEPAPPPPPKTIEQII